MSPHRSPVWLLFVVYPRPRTPACSRWKYLASAYAEVSSDAWGKTSADRILEANLATTSWSSPPAGFACAPCLEGINTASAMGSKQGGSLPLPSPLLLHLPFLLLPAVV